MQILDIRHVEDCLDQSFIKEIEMDETITEAHLSLLNTFGELTYYDHFPRPLYKIVRPYFWEIKGVIASTTFKVIFYRENKEQSLKLFIEEMDALKS